MVKGGSKVGAAGADFMVGGGGWRDWEVLIDGGCGERPLGGQVLSRGSAADQEGEEHSTKWPGYGVGPNRPGLESYLVIY